MVGAQLPQVLRVTRGQLIVADFWQQLFRGAKGRQYIAVPRFALMATGDPENARVRRLESRYSTGSPIRSSNNQDTADPDYCFSSSDHIARRPSTSEDEHRVKNLLKEVLAYRETNVSSWIVECCQDVLLVFVAFAQECNLICRREKCILIFLMRRCIYYAKILVPAEDFWCTKCFLAQKNSHLSAFKATSTEGRRMRQKASDEGGREIENPSHASVFLAVHSCGTAREGSQIPGGLTNGCFGQSDILTADEIEQIKTHLKTEDNLWSDLKQLFKTNGWVSDTKLVLLLEKPLMRLSNFHLRNGAMMWRLNWQADLSVRGLGNSCGIMVNYRYFLEDTESNSQMYLEKQKIVASDDVRQLALNARELMELTSKM
ncbi:hypothetical protein C0J52_16312 [Blattella germanica]|nr:hypothetical protein C0J52_16312 [Blattella germanica]